MLRISRRIYNQIYPRVGTRVTLPFLLIVLAVAGIGIFVMTRLVVGTIDERLNNQLRDGVQTVTNAITEIERANIATLRLLTFIDGVSDAIEANDSGTIDLLLSGVATNQGIDEVIVFNQAGDNIFRTLIRRNEDVPQLLDLSEWQIVTDILTEDFDERGDKFVTIRIVDERNVIYFAGPVYNNDDQIIGGVIVGIESLRFVRLLSEQAFANLVFTDLNGVIIDSTIRPLVPPDPTNAGTFIEQPQELNEQLTAGSTPLQERVIQTIEYRFLYAPFELRERQVGFMGIALSTDFVADRIGTSRNAFGLLFGILFLSVTLMGVVVSRSIIGPLFRMVDTTRAIREGDLSRRVQLPSPDELGELGRSFDHMTDQLVERNAKINDLYINQLEETARRDAVLSSISDVVIVQDREGKIILYNDAAEKMRDRLRNYDADRKQFIETLRRAEALSSPETIKLIDGYFSVLATPVRMKTGALLGYVFSFRDITALVESQRLKDELILQLSHELRTPYAAAYGYAELTKFMIDSGQTGGLEGNMDNVMSQLAKLGSMLNRVVEVSTILAEKVDIYKEETELVTLVREVIDGERAAIEKEGLQLDLMFSVECLMIKIDAERIKDAIHVVIENAYQYTLEGGEIQVYLWHDEHYANIEIVDTGVGIGEDEIGKVFDRMFRGRSADAGLTDSRGLGLGLYISKQYIDLHDGIIEVESTEQVGTTVHIQLPLESSI